MYKVAVVIPVFRVEDYIVRCAESLFSQTLDDMQFIFVDDASPDNSISLLEQTLDRFPRRKTQTQILHHAKNRGLPTARATGLARVEAPYVAHCDSDDYVEPTMYARLYEKAVKNDSDMVICGRIIHHIDGREHSDFDKASPGDSLIHNFLYGRLKAYVWTRLTRTDIYRQVLFPIENYYEDWVQTAQLLICSQKVSFLDEPLYHYNLRPKSIQSDIMGARPEVIESKVRQCMVNYNLMHDFIADHFQVEEKDFALMKENVRSLFLLSNISMRFRKQYLQTFREINLRLLFSPIIPLQNKAYHLLVLLGLHLVAKTVYDYIRKG